MFNHYKTLCSPAQNPDPQGHSGALGKHNFQTYVYFYMSCIIYIVQYVDISPYSCTVVQYITVQFYKRWNGSYDLYTYMSYVKNHWVLSVHIL